MNINKPKLAILPFIFLAIAVIANYFTPGTTILWLAAWIAPLFEGELGSGLKTSQNIKRK